MAGFIKGEFAGLPTGLIREIANEDGAFEFEVPAHIARGDALAHAKLGELIVVAARQSAPGAPPYSWAKLQTAAAFQAAEAARLAAQQTESGDASQPDTAGAAKGEEATPSRPSRSRRPSPPQSETVNDESLSDAPRAPSDEDAES